MGFNNKPADEIILQNQNILNSFLDEQIHPFPQEQTNRQTHSHTLIFFFINKKPLEKIGLKVS